MILLLNSKKKFTVPLIIALAILVGCGSTFVYKQNMKKPLPSKVHVIYHDLSGEITESENRRIYDKDGVEKEIVYNEDGVKTERDYTKKEKRGKYELTSKGENDVITTVLTKDLTLISSELKQKNDDYELTETWRFKDGYPAQGKVFINYADKTELESKTTKYEYSFSGDDNDKTCIVTINENGEISKWQYDYNSAGHIKKRIGKYESYSYEYVNGKNDLLTKIVEYNDEDGSLVKEVMFEYGDTKVSRAKYENYMKRWTCNGLE